METLNGYMNYIIRINGGDDLCVAHLPNRKRPSLCLFNKEKGYTVLASFASEEMVKLWNEFMEKVATSERL